jgi:hypothetical protein
MLIHFCQKKTLNKKLHTSKPAHSARKSCTRARQFAACHRKHMSSELQAKATSKFHAVSEVA